MEGEYVSIPAESGAAFDAYCLLAPRGPAPGIVMLTEIFGITAEMRAEAVLWAEAGFAVLVPDPFWRQQPRAVLGYEGADRARAFELYTKFDHEQGAVDAGHAVAALRGSTACNGRVAVVGYCFGGTLA
jgi:carboxymethylenebutenolidase